MGKNISTHLHSESNVRVVFVRILGNCSFPNSGKLISQCWQQLIQDYVDWSNLLVQVQRGDFLLEIHIILFEDVYITRKTQSSATLLIEYDTVAKFNFDRFAQKKPRTVSFINKSLNKTYVDNLCKIFLCFLGPIFYE